MTNEKIANQLAALEAENQRLRDVIASQNRGITQDATDSARRDRLHERNLAAAKAENASLDELHQALVRDAHFNSQVLEYTTDCIKVLSLDGTLEFMSAGGMRVMEIDDFTQFRGCPWPDFWQGELTEKARSAVTEARAGRVGRFEGPANTAKGTPRYWEVTVSPIFNSNGEPEKVLSISRDITDRHRAELQQRTLFEEMHHRVKNTLSNTIAIANYSFRNTQDPTASLAAFTQRLNTLAKAHDLLIANHWIDADLKEVVQSSVAAYAAPGLVIEGPSLRLSSRSALSLSMLLNELCTNAVKYGAWSNAEGQVSISWQVEEDGTFTFRWQESGGPRVTAPTRVGFGSRLIEQLMPESLGAKASVDYAAGGLIFVMQSPVSALTTL